MQMFTLQKVYYKGMFSSDSFYSIVLFVKSINIGSYTTYGDLIPSL